MQVPMSKTKRIAKTKQEKKLDDEAQQEVHVAEDMKEVQIYVENLMRGEEKLSNPCASDVLDQLRASAQELSQLTHQITSIKQTLRRAEDRRTALEAVSQQLAINLYRWRKHDKKDE